MRGHNTAYNAGVFAREMGCKVVALNHFGSASSGKDYVSSMVNQARQGNQNASQIIASYDFLEVFIPRNGFEFDSKATSEQLSASELEKSKTDEKMENDDSSNYYNQAE